MTREDIIKEGRPLEPNMFETDGEETWYGVGLYDGATANPWISVKDRLPDIRETVLVRSGDDTFLASVDFRHIASKNSYWFMKNGESRFVQKYDFYIPIPELPKGGTE